LELFMKVGRMTRAGKWELVPLEKESTGVMEASRLM
jgi:hypothetical protein